MSSSIVHHGWRRSCLFLDLLDVMSLFVLPQAMDLKGGGEGTRRPVVEGSVVTCKPVIVM